jgi:hypothetical protein
MDLLKPFTSRGFVIGIGLAALAYLLGPQIKQGAKTVAVKGMQGAMVAGDAASQAVASGREKMGSMMQNMGNKGDTMVQQMVSEFKEEREQVSNTLNELVNTMKSMQEEISLLKEGQRTV